jgi:DNA repair exonuclease SbcCD ATPase subunit
MFTLQSIVIEGFRGFPKRLDFDLDVPVVLAAGPNGTGKTSLVCAIEWCLFGQDVETEAHTGIRERISWESRNRGAAQCFVEMELVGDGETLLVHRSASKSGKPEFWYRLGSNPPSHEGGKLTALLGGLEIRDFFTAIHLHEESLRGLLLAKPGERKQDFYRLLGLISLLNQTRAIADAKLDSLLEAVDDDFEKFELALEAKVQTRQADLQRAREECLKQGLAESDLSAQGLSKLWTTLVTAARRFCTTYSMKDCDLPDGLPEGDAVHIAKEQLHRLRSSCPVLQDRGEVLTRINTLNALRDSYQKADKELAEAKAQIKKLPPERRDLSKLAGHIDNLERDLEKKKRKRTEANAKAAVLSEALQYFETAGLRGKAKCPVCQKEIDSVEQIHKHYEEEIQKGIIAPLEEEIKQLQKQLREAKDAKATLEDLQADAARREKLLSGHKDKIASALGRVLAAKDDPVALLAGELGQLGQKKAELEKQVQKAEESLTKIDRQIENVAKALEVLRYRDEVAVLAKVSKSEVFKEVEGSRLEMEEFVRAVETLSRSLNRTLEEEADKRLGAVRDDIAKTFAALTGRSDFTHLAVSPDTRFAAQVQGSAGVADALAILNKADTNCAALSVFLALAAAPSTEHRLGFLILDDPNQGLDPTHTQRLAQVLSKICESRQLVLSTMDEGLCDQMQRTAPKKKVIYRFRDWNHRTGPKIEKVG